MRQIYIALAILAALSYGNAIGNPFVHDDVVFIVDNPQVHQPGHFSQIFLNNHFPIPQDNGAVANAYYRPFLDIVYRLEYWFLGSSPWGYHFINILIHWLNAVLVLMVTMRLTQRLMFAGGTAVVFLVHPIQSEAVACISGISNLLFTFFVLVSFWQYLRAMDQASADQKSWLNVSYVSSLGLFIAALFCKEQAIVLAGIIVLYEVCFCQSTPGSSGAKWGRVIGIAGVAGAYLIWRKVILGGFATDLIGNWGEFILRMKSLPGIVVAQLCSIVLPVNLHYYRSYDILAPWVVPGIIFVLIVLACFVFYQILPQPQRGMFIFGWGWFLIALSPTTSLVPLFHEYSLIAMFEHFLYLPLIGVIWCMIIVFEHGINGLKKNHSSWLKKGVFIVIICTGILLTNKQNQVWSGEVPLFEKAVKHEPRMGRLRLLLAKAYFSKKEIRKAEKEFLLARDLMAGYLNKIRDPRLNPFYYGFLRESLLGLAACQEAKGDFVQAKGYYERILIFAPRDYIVLNNLGVIAIRLRHLDEAVVNFRKAIAIQPNFVPAQHNLKILLQQQSQNP